MVDSCFLQSAGPHIYQTCPSANYFDCKAMSIGARSQSARTYLEKHLSEFPDCSRDELIKHGLRALRDTLPNEVDLSVKVSIQYHLTSHVITYESLHSLKDMTAIYLCYVVPLCH